MRPSRQPLQPGAGDGVVGAHLHRALVGFDRLGLVALLFVCEAKTGPRVGVVGVDVERGVEVLDGGVVLAGGEQALAARLIGRAGERVAVDGVLKSVIACSLLPRR